MPVVFNHISKYHGNEVAQALVAELSLICRAVPAVVYEMLSVRVAFHYLYRSKQQIASYFYVLKLIFSFWQEAASNRAGKPLPVVYSTQSPLLTIDTASSGVLSLLLYSEINFIYYSPFTARLLPVISQGYIHIHKVKKRRGNIRKSAAVLKTARLLCYMHKRYVVKRMGRNDVARPHLSSDLHCRGLP